MTLDRSSPRVQHSPAKRGTELLIQNAIASSAYADIVRKTYGPCGANILLENRAGNQIEITNDAITIMQIAQPNHPVARMMFSVARVQDAEYGNGTTGATVFSSDLLKQAITLMESGVASRFIVSGFNRAVEKACALLDALSFTIRLGTVDQARAQHKLLKNIAMTAIASKYAGEGADVLCDHMIECVLAVTEEQNSELHTDLDAISVVKRSGGAVEESVPFKGIVLENTRKKQAMPDRLEQAVVALVDGRIEIKKTLKATIDIKDPQQIHAFLDEEEAMVRAMYDALAASGVTAVFCTNTINDRLTSLCVKNGIMAFEDVNLGDLRKLETATGATIVKNVGDVAADTTGSAPVIKEKLLGDSAVTIVKARDDVTTISLVLRGGTQQARDEMYRAVHDVAMTLKAFLEDGKIVAGGGAAYLEVAHQLRAYAREFSNREQVAIEAFADALELLPRTLIANAGLDATEHLAALRHQHAEGKKNTGIMLPAGTHTDMFAAGIIEPANIMKHALRLPVAVVSMVLRIDEVIPARYRPTEMDQYQADLDKEMRGGGMPPMM